MHKPLLALPVSQHFNQVFPKLTKLVKVLVLRSPKNLPDEFEPIYRKAYHTGGLVNNQFAAEMTEDFASALNDNGIFHLSFDLGPSCRDVVLNPEKNDIYWPQNASPVLGPEEILMIAGERIKKIKSKFQGSIALENLDYHSGGAYESVCNPDFISEAARKLKVKLAVDIGHILVTCYNLKIDPFKYILSLPLGLVSEVHLSHPQEDNDMHGCPTKEEYSLLSYLLSKSKPVFVVVEYYCDPVRIVEENIKLYNFLNN